MKREGREKKNEWSELKNGEVFVYDLIIPRLPALLADVDGWIERHLNIYFRWGLWVHWLFREWIQGNRIKVLCLLR